jgi:hypothetical protein
MFRQAIVYRHGKIRRQAVDVVGSSHTGSIRWRMTTAAKAVRGRLYFFEIVTEAAAIFV